MSTGLSGLRAERKTSGIGLLIFGELERAMRIAIKGRDPRVYGGGASSWDTAFDDALQGLVEDLLRYGQLDYVLDEAGGLGDLRALMVEQARRHLSRSRARGVIDQLLLRCRKIVSDPAEGFVVHSRRGRSVRSFALAPLSVEERQATEGELKRAIRGCATFPVTPGVGGEQRAPAVYSTQALRGILRRACELTPCVLTLRDLDDIFRGLLTDWVVSDLDDIEELFSLRSTEVDPAVRIEAENGARSLVLSLSSDDLRLLAMAMNGAPIGDVAEALGVSKQTVHTRRKKIHAEVRKHLDEDSEGATECFLDELHLQLAEKVIV